MNAVTKIRPDVRSITVPDEIAKLQAWLIWRYEPGEGDSKPRKIPYYTNGGKRHGVQGRPEDRQNLTTFEAAKVAAARKGFDGVGFCPLPEFNITALDFDHCAGEGGLHPEVERLVAGTYAEWSPSGEGVRALFRGRVENNKDHSLTPFGFETFSTNGFVTFTGNRLEVTDLLGCENTVADLTDDVRNLCAQRFGQRARAQEDGDALMTYEPQVGLTLQQIADLLDVLDPDMGYKPWTDLGMAIHHETGGSDEGFYIWNQWSSSGSKYSSDAKLRGHWDSFGNHSGRPVTARTLIRMARENGAYISTAVVREADPEFGLIDLDRTEGNEGRNHLLEARPGDDLGLFEQWRHVGVEREVQSVFGSGVQQLLECDLRLASSPVEHEHHEALAGRALCALTLPSAHRKAEAHFGSGHTRSSPSNSLTIRTSARLLTLALRSTRCAIWKLSGS